MARRKKETRIQKAHRICYVLSRAKEPLTRNEVMQRVDDMEGKDELEFNSLSSALYWSPTHSMASPATAYSVIVRGLVERVGRKGRGFAYVLTDEGRRLARQYKKLSTAAPAQAS
jgi:hypothetical protein